MQVLMENLLTRFSSYQLQIQMRQRILVMRDDVSQSEAQRGFLLIQKSKNNGILRIEALV